MEAVEFMKQKNRMCDYYCGAMCTHDDSGETCPAQSIDCGITTEQLVAIVEKWAKDHPEETSAATSHKSDEPCVKTIQDGHEVAIYRAIASHKTRIEKLEYDVSVVRNNLAVLGDQIYALREKVSVVRNNLAVLGDQICALREKVYHTPAKEPSQTPEPKRTNKDVLLAAFPNARVDKNGIPNVCPYELDERHP